MSHPPSRAALSQSPSKPLTREDIYRAIEAIYAQGLIPHGSEKDPHILGPGGRYCLSCGWERP